MLPSKVMRPSPGLLAASLLVAAGCNLSDAPTLRDAHLGDGSSADGSWDTSADEAPDRDGPGDDRSGPIGGPLTAVAESFSLITERTCDLDGDGLGDNALADLGERDAALLARALEALLQGQIADGLVLPLLHFPWLDDAVTPEDPSAVAIFFEGDDLDDPPVPDDNHSGEEPFYVSNEYLDGCGEPRFVFPSMAVTEGAYSGTTEELPLPMISGLTLRGARGTGLLGLDGGRGFLELLVAGGVALGIPAIPGLRPNLDFDGDGLERAELDDEGHVARCVDGDGSVVEGEACWSDPRMADGLAMAWRFDTVPAVFSGRHPDWREDVEEGCDEPPETSLFDPQ